jgi:hypothetical protein
MATFTSEAPKHKELVAATSALLVVAFSICPPDELMANLKNGFAEAELFT